MIDYNEENIERWATRKKITDSQVFREAHMVKGIFPKYECKHGTLAKIRADLMRDTPDNADLGLVENYSVFHVVDHRTKYNKEFFVLAPDAECMQAWLDSDFKDQMLYTLRHCSRRTHKIAMDIGGMPTIIYFGEGQGMLMGRNTMIQKPDLVLHDENTQESEGSSDNGDIDPYDDLYI